MAPLNPSDFTPGNESAGLEDGAGFRDVLDFTIDESGYFNFSDTGLPDGLYSKPLDEDMSPGEAEATESPWKAQRLQYNFEGGQRLKPAQDLLSPRRPAGLGVEAFKKSYLACWLPAQQDSVQAELNQLSNISQDENPWNSPLHLSPQPFCKAIETSSRDALLAMILTTCGPDKVSTIAALLTPPLIDGLTRLFLAHHRDMSTSIIHAPTFNPNSKRAELLAAVVAMGGNVSDSKTFQRLALALQEVIRVSIPTQCESSNAVTRDIEILQAFIFEMEIGLWSGNRRKMEIAESHPQILVTVSPQNVP